MSLESIVNGWIPVKEDPDLQIKYKETKETIIEHVDEHIFQLAYAGNETAQFGKDGTAICSYKVPANKKFDVFIRIVITDK